LQLQLAFAKGQLKGRIAVEGEAKKSFINNVVSIQSSDHISVFSIGYCLDLIEF